MNHCTAVPSQGNREKLPAAIRCGAGAPELLPRGLGQALQGTGQHAGTWAQWPCLDRGPGTQGQYIWDMGSRGLPRADPSHVEMATAQGSHTSQADLSARGPDQCRVSGCGMPGPTLTAHTGWQCDLGCVLGQVLLWEHDHLTPRTSLSPWWAPQTSAPTETHADTRPPASAFSLTAAPLHPPLRPPASPSPFQPQGFQA